MNHVELEAKMAPYGIEVGLNGMKIMI